MPNFFVDPAQMGAAQLSWAFVSYGYVLGLGANMIGDGSELLMLVPSIAGIVGSIVVPILGAVPDGMMVLFSGMKPEVAAAQSQVTVGIGALAGSTIMLLALTSFVAILGGRVDIKDGKCMYKQRPKLTSAGGLTSSGVEISADVKQNGIVMLITSLSFLVIQIPALGVDTNNTDAPIGPESQAEHVWAGLGLLLCIIEFVGYCGLQYYRNNMSQGDEAACLSRKTTDLTNLIAENGLGMYIEDYKKKMAETGEGSVGSLHPVAKKALENFFKKYAGSDKVIDLDEFAGILRDINCPFTKAELDALFAQVDSDKSGKISQEEFLDGFSLLVKKSKPAAKPSIEGEDADEDEDDMPEEWKDLSPEEQQKRILLRSFTLMGWGSLLVLIFSDPMVDVMSAMGAMSGIPPFFVAFVLAPVASNASELLSTYKFATKKTSMSITTSFSTVIGAACMNNTYCLGIFFGLIYFQGLAWRFTAETSAILAVLVIMGLVSLFKKQLTLLEGFFILSLYPLSLVLVLQMESMGYD